MSKFKFYKQPNYMDCGPTCLRMICRHFGKIVSQSQIKSLIDVGKEGVTLKSIADASENIGFRTIGVKIDYNKLEREAPLPCIIHWEQNHYIVVYRINKKYVWVANPAHGLIKLTKKEFMAGWSSIKENNSSGVALLFDVTPDFYTKKLDGIDEKKGLGFLYKYLTKYKKYLIQLLIGLIAGSLLQLVFPFLTQSIVDVGIQNQDISFIYLILIAQLVLFVGKISIELIRSWILLHISARINIALVSDFFIKIMKLPISFFDAKITGDILQRINDHQRIESLLTNSSLNVLFSIFNLFIFGAILAWYSLSIFLVFFIGSSLYVLWVMLFLRKRKKLDYMTFDLASAEQNKIIELISGMQEIKLHNAEKQKRWGWEIIQAKLFRLEIKNLSLEQTQEIGSNIINELKNILIIVLSAKLVIDGEITLGMMIAITYIVGQLNAPIMQLVNFVHTLQDAKIAIERLAEIHSKKNEEVDTERKINVSKEINSIEIKNLKFRYKGNHRSTLNDITISIPKNKTTAIVGASGSGKTTLLKMILKFYDPDSGSISYGPIDLNNISQQSWRDKCGVVMQGGFVFDDSIANNISIGNESFDAEKLNLALELACIKEFVDSLPNGIYSKIGFDGIGMSAGQKQRLLIARAIYKNPDIICFDEATSALDAENERLIMENLNEFFKNRTAVVIAHRLSTVKNADQIIVLDKGKIVERGTHSGLIENNGPYYNLVKNQLELEKLHA